MIRPIVIAHRGASAEAPENTIPSVKRAWELGAEAVEVDIRRTKDDRLVAMHDPTTGRTAGINRSVRTTTWARLQELDVGSWKDARFKGERIPLLEEILETVPPGRKLVIEVKSGPEIVPILEPSLQDERWSGIDICIVSFHLSVLKRIREAAPGRFLAWLQGSAQGPEPDTWRPHPQKIIDKALAYDLNGLSVHFGGVTPDFTREVAEVDLMLYVWTINEPDRMKQMIDLGVDGITTDHPGRLRDLLDGMT